jgi:general secretion pathway protein A
MYESFFELRENPFNLNPDPEYIYMSEGHENAHTHLEYAVMESKGFVVLTGEIGSGKTTLLNLFLSEISDEIQVGLINHTFVTPIQFIRKTCREFEVEVDSNDKDVMVEAFHDFLLQQYASGNRVILIIDEAQNLPLKTLEEVRMLSNIESEKSHLIQIILVGQPELKLKLRKKELQQFAQRITVHCHLDALDEKEVKAYIQYRLKVGGAKRDNIFSDEAINAIARHSKGIPRMINILCDSALVYAFADSKDFVDKKIVTDVVRERAAGGIFIDDSTLEDPAAPASIDAASLDSTSLLRMVGNINAHERILRVEETVRSFADRLTMVHQELSLLKNLVNKRDTIVIEMLRSLRRESRKNNNPPEKMDDKRPIKN